MIIPLGTSKYTFFFNFLLIYKILNFNAVILIGQALEDGEVQASNNLMEAEVSVVLELTKIFIDFEIFQISKLF